MASSSSLSSSSCKKGLTGISFTPLSLGMLQEVMSRQESPKVTEGWICWRQCLTYFVLGRRRISFIFCWLGSSAAVVVRRYFLPLSRKVYREEGGCCCFLQYRGGWVFVLLSASTLKYTNVMRFHYQWYACREDFLSPSNQVQQYCTEEQQLKHWCDRARKTKKKTFLDHDDDDCQQKKQ